MALSGYTVGGQAQFGGQPQFGYQQQPIQGIPLQHPQGMQYQHNVEMMHPGMQYQNPHNPDMMYPGMLADQKADGPIAAQPSYIRSNFIQKVYSILSVQLLATVAIAFYMHQVLGREWVLKHASIFMGMSLVGVASLLGVSCCCAHILRQFPLNFIFLAIFTVCQAAATSLFTMMYTTDSVLLALTVTAGVFLALTAFACVTKSDFTGIGVYLFALLAVLIIFGLVIYLWPLFTGQAPPRALRLVYAGFAVLLFMFYIIHDTQLIVGGTHKKHQFSVDDYVFAALNLYLDIINLFTYILQILGSRQ